MRDFYSSLLTLLLMPLVFCAFSLASSNAIAQCAECTPDSSCMSADGFPMMCPLVPPDATVNDYYSENITFYLPSTVTAQGFTATIQEVEITSITGLPFGLVLTFNGDDNVFLPASGENFGCATVCGTPLIPGTYQVSINANVTVVVSGFETSLPQSFSTTLTVVPGEGETNSFTFDQSAGCGSVEVDFYASYNAPAPSITTYSWVFSNGETSSLANPENILFETPGSYNASLTTTISALALEQVSITGLSDGWFSELLDEELFGFGDPDPYFILVNGNNDTVYTSESITNTETPSWTLSPITLNDPPYSIVFFDDDPISEDDFLGEFTITLSEGPNSFNASDGTAGNYEIGQLITTQITDSTTIQVFPLPDSTLTLNNNIATVEEQDFTSIVWYQDGSLTDAFIGNTATLTEGGQYSAQVTNMYGCSVNTNQVTYCAPVTIEYTPAAQELYVSEGFASYQWYFNGIAMKGGNNYYVNTNEPGNYSVVVTTEYGCVTESEVYILIISVEEQNNTLVNLFPIPSRDNINVQLTTPAPWAITDITGRTIMAKQASSSAFTINIESLPVGVYFLQANESRIRFVKE
jgi:hypothetical protein